MTATLTVVLTALWSRVPKQQRLAVLDEWAGSDDSGLPSTATISELVGEFEAAARQHEQRTRTDG